MNEFFCYENGGKIIKVLCVKIESNFDLVFSGVIFEYFFKNIVFVNK